MVVVELVLVRLIRVLIEAVVVVEEVVVPVSLPEMVVGLEQDDQAMPTKFKMVLVEVLVN